MMDWIKLSTTMFDDDKIRLLQSGKNGDEMICIWLQLLCFAGKQDNDGVFLLTGNTAYTADQIAVILGRDRKRFCNALDQFEALGMIVIDNGCITLPNWGKYNSDSVTRNTYRNANKERQQRYRDRQRNVTRNVTDNVTDCNESRYVTPTEKEEEKEKEYITTTGGSNSVTGVTQRIVNVWPNLPQIAIEEIISFQADLPEEVIAWALDETRMHPGAGYKYFRAILQRCTEQGLKTLDAVKQAEADRKASQERGRQTPKAEPSYQQHKYSQDDEASFYTDISAYMG